jgi:hypothetical protein
MRLLVSASTASGRITTSGCLPFESLELPPLAGEQALGGPALVRSGPVLGSGSIRAGLVVDQD